MQPTTATLWLEAGYQLFALEGPAALQVEPLARNLNRSKSSFYHHFGDLAAFRGALLERHLTQARMLAHRESQCANLDPDLILLLLEFRTDLLFSRQLRIHMREPAFARCLQAASEAIGPEFWALWAREMDLATRPDASRALYDRLQDTFFLQLTHETLTEDALRGFFQQVRQLVNSLKTTPV
jgi:AcrR family transcriptional regulator